MIITENSNGEKKVHQKSSFIPKSERKCYNWRMFGHTSPDVFRNKPKVSSVTSQPFSQGFNEESDAKVSFIISISTSSTTDYIAGKITTKGSSSCNRGKQAITMSFSAGYVEGKPVTILKSIKQTNLVRILYNWRSLKSFGILF